MSNDMEMYWVSKMADFHPHSKWEIFPNFQKKTANLKIFFFFLWGNKEFYYPTVYIPSNCLFFAMAQFN